jgi:beta-glucanase (GH16 family)
MKMKKILKTIIGVTAVSLMMMNTFAIAEASSASPQYDLVKINRNPGNLIISGGFEERSNWKTTGDGEFTNYAGCAAVGEWCGLLPSNSGDACVYQVINVKPNTEYVAKAKVLLSKEGATALLNVKTPDVRHLIGDAEKTISCTKAQEWTYQNVELKFNSCNEQQIALCVMKWTTDNTSLTFKQQAYVDDVELFEKSTSSVDEKYNIVWADDFNGSKLDLSKWEYELGSIRGIEQQHYVDDKENVFIRDNGDGGELVLKATDRPKELQYNHPRNSSRKIIYNSGSVRTHGKKEFLYGRIEMKAKLPKGQSVFPAFWTLGSDFVLDGDVSNEQGYGWARCGEMDIMELIGSKQGGVRNKTVYQTLHTQNGSENGYHKLGGTAYTIPKDFNDDYHIFGMNWSKGKIEWYVDDKIVSVIDYSKDSVASKCLDRPQYIEMNLAMGGIWPGQIGEGLDGTEYVVDYVYYAQNDKQKADAEAYYKDSPKIIQCDDISIYEGDTDVLSNVVVSDNADIDFSVTDTPQFSIKEKNASSENPITSVDLLCKGKKDLSSLAKLPAGEYYLYYTALPKDLEFDVKSNGEMVPSAAELYKFDRKGVKLTIKERN